MRTRFGREADANGLTQPFLRHGLRRLDDELIAWRQDGTAGMGLVLHVSLFMRAIVAGRVGHWLTNLNLLLGVGEGIDVN